MATKAQLDHARSFELRTAVLAILDELAPEGFTEEQYWTAYAKAYGMDTDNAALFGYVQAVL